MTPFVAFGYRKTKTDKHKLEIDPSAGSVVQDIFKMKLRGMSPVSYTHLDVYKRQGRKLSVYFTIYQ